MTSISVIVPTCNRAPLLARCLAAIERQAHLPQLAEVLVIDNGSTDDTLAVCRSFAGRLPGFAVFRDDRPGLLTGRHVGFARSTGDVLAFLDDDAEPHKTHLAGLADTFAEPAVGLVGGKCLPSYESPPPNWLQGLVDWHPKGWFVVAHSLIDLGDTVMDVHPNYVFGCNFSVRRTALATAGGFHPDSIPRHLMRWCGDGETPAAQGVARAGYRVLYDPRCSIDHWVSTDRMMPGYMHHRYFYEGVVQSFAAIRRNRGPLPEPEMEAHLRDWELVPAQSTGDLRAALEHKRAGYLEGFRFHHTEVRNDPELLRWVLKDDYFDIR